jgi:DNA replication protein DnaC
MLPFTPCEKCSNQIYSPIPKDHITPPPGYLYHNIDGVYTVLTECECHIKWAKENLMYIKAGKANLWTTSEAIEYDPVKSRIGDRDSMKIHMIRQHLPELVKGMCLYISGGFSTQKTTLAQWIGLETFRRGHTAYYESMHNFITNLVPTGFNDLEKHKAYYDKVMAVDVLILDNVFEKARTNMQAFHIPYIESMLRDRIEQNHKSVIFVSSNNLESIKDENAQSLAAFIKKVSFSNKITLTDSTTGIKVDSIFEDK